MKMKKITAALLAILICVFGSINVSAMKQLYLTSGGCIDFESGFTGSDKELLEQDDEYGKSVKLVSGGELRVLLGSSASPQNDKISDGNHILSFDIKMSHISDNVRTMIYFWNSEEARNDEELKVVTGKTLGLQEQVLTVQSGMLLTSKGTSFTNERYSADKWSHVDLRFRFESDTERIMEIYLNGEYDGEVNLLDFGIWDVCAMVLLFGDYDENIDGAVQFADNFALREDSETATSSLSYTYDSKIKVSFSENVKDIEADDFKVTRKPVSGGSEQAVAFTAESLSNAGAVLAVDMLEDGYEYKVSVDAKTVFGKDVEASTFVLKNAVSMDESFDTVASTLANIETEEYRGEYIAPKENKKIMLRLPNEVSEGRYIFSYDAKHLDEAMYEGNCFDVETMSGTNAGAFQAISSEHYISGYNSNGSLNTLTSTAFADDTWYRIDNLIDLNSKTASVFVNGAYTGEISLWDKDYNQRSAFQVLRFSWKHFNPGKLDNIKFRNYTADFIATANNDDGKIYIDFNETVGTLQKTNFKLEVADNAMATLSGMDFDLVYQNGVRAVLNVADGVEEGKFYRISYKNIKSVFGKTLVNDSSSFGVSGNGVSVIDEILFGDAEGSVEEVNNVSSALSEILISVPEGLKDDEFNGTVTFKASGDTITYTPEYDKDKKLLKLKLDKLPGSGKTCELTISGMQDESDNVYSDIVGTFMTGEAVFSLDNMRKNVTSDGIEVSVDCVNTLEDVTYYMLVTKYDSLGKMVGISVYLVESDSNDADITKKVLVTDDISDCAEATCHIWKNGTEITPVVNSLILK